ncbi:MAG TPA: exodeoxyribonuclease VII small subunit [Gammaproteobacteria bacterium]|nr:exodeoxyribonuclease VII small subunit [Gammaproteobacteria bacterium]
MARRKAPPKPPKNIEEALQQLETLVVNLEQGDLSLDESLAQFEQGIALTRYCQETLTQAELKVQQLVKGDKPEGPQEATTAAHE